MVLGLIGGPRSAGDISQACATGVRCLLRRRQEVEAGLPAPR